MCADTQESLDEQKSYTEKITVLEDRSYPISVGGAGFGDLIDCMTDEILERVKAGQPSTKKELKALLQDSLNHVYATDLPTLICGKQHRTPQLIIAAKTTEGFCIFTTKGRRVLKEAARAIIGYGTEPNFELLKRLHRPTLPMQQAVMLAIYLTSQSIRTDRDVGGDPRIAVIVDNGAWIDNPHYVKAAEQRVKQFIALSDYMFLTCIDLSISPTDYTAKMSELMQHVDDLRTQHYQHTAAYLLHRQMNDPTYRGEPYPKLFPGAVMEVSGTGAIAVREDTAQEIEQRRALWQAAQQGYNRNAMERFNWLLTKDGRTPLYLGEEIVHIQGTAGPITVDSEATGADVNT